MAEWNEKMVEEIQKNMINKPPHYCREDAMECIDEMVVVFGAEIVANFCLCNVWKYRYRAGQKNGEQDIKKSDWYMAKYIQMLRIIAEGEGVE